MPTRLDTIMRIMGERVFNWHLEAAMSAWHALRDAQDRRDYEAAHTYLTILGHHLAVLHSGDVPNEGEARRAEVRAVDAPTPAMEFCPAGTLAKAARLDAAVRLLKQRASAMATAGHTTSHFTPANTPYIEMLAMLERKERPAPDTDDAPGAGREDA